MRNQCSLRVYRMLDNLPTIGGAIVIIVAVALFMLGIIAVIASAPVLEDGTVADTSFKAARTEIQFYTTIDSNGNTITHSKPVHYPNKWSIQVVGVRENGEPRSEWWEVGEGMYAQIGIGDWVHRDAKLGVVSIVRKVVAEDATRSY